MSSLDAGEIRAVCIEAFTASWSAREISSVTIENSTGVLNRFLLLLDVQAWETVPEDVDRCSILWCS